MTPRSRVWTKAERDAFEARTVRVKAACAAAAARGGAR